MLLSSTSSMKIKEKKTDKPALAGVIGLFVENYFTAFFVENYFTAFFVENYFTAFFVGNYFTAFFAVYSSGFSVSFATSMF